MIMQSVGISWSASIYLESRLSSSVGSHLKRSDQPESLSRDRALKAGENGIFRKRKRREDLKYIRGEPKCTITTKSFLF